MPTQQRTMGLLALGILFCFSLLFSFNAWADEELTDEPVASGPAVTLDNSDQAIDAFTAAATATASAAALGPESTVRDPAAQDEVFTPEYMDQINSAEQQKKAEDQEQQEQHEKAMDLWFRH